MKDIIITAKSLKRELVIALCCFILANGVNVYAILKYDRHFSELFSQIGFVIVLAAVIYVILLAVRLVIHAIGAITRKK